MSRLELLDGKRGTPVDMLGSSQLGVCTHPLLPKSCQFMCNNMTHKYSVCVFLGSVCEILFIKLLPVNIL